jgi:hypothetical protein
MKQTYTEFNDLLQLLKKNESKIEFLSALENLGCTIPLGQQT